MSRIKWVTAVALAAVLVAVSAAVVGCNKENNPPEPPEPASVIAFDKAEPYFGAAGEKLYPVEDDSPNTTVVASSVRLTMGNTAKIGFSFESEDMGSEYLRFTVPGGDIVTAGEGITEALTNTLDTAKTFEIRVWLSSDAPESLAGKSFTFDIKARGAASVKAADWQSETVSSGNTVTAGAIMAYEWPARANEVKALGISADTFKGVYDGNPLDLTEMLGVD